MTFQNYQDKQNKNLSYQSDLGYPWEKSSENISVEDKKKRMVDQTDKIYGHDLNWYLKIFGWPTFSLIVFKIILEVCYRRYFPLLPEETISWIFLGLRWLTFLIIPLIAFLKFKTIYYQALISNFSAAFIAGVIISLFLLFWYGELWTIFNLIGLPLLMIFESVIIATIVYGFIKIFRK